MKRGGGDAGDNPRGKTNIQFFMKTPKFLMQMKQSVQTDEQAKIKEWEDRLNKDEDYDIQGAQIVSDERDEPAKKKEDNLDDKVDMETFKPKFLSKKSREKGGLNDLKEEIELRKQQDLKKKQEQLEKLEKSQKEQDNNTEENNKPKKQENLILLNQKKKSFNDALQQLEKDTTKLKKVKKNLLSFNDDDEDY